MNERQPLRFNLRSLFVLTGIVALVSLAATVFPGDRVVWLFVLALAFAGSVAAARRRPGANLLWLLVVFLGFQIVGLLLMGPIQR